MTGSQTIAHLGLSASLLKGPPQSAASFISNDRWDTINFAFLDGDHSEEAIRNDICGLFEYLNIGAYVLCHHAVNEQTSRGIDTAIKASGLTDCALVGYRVPIFISVCALPRWRSRISAA